MYSGDMLILKSIIWTLPFWIKMFGKGFLWCIRHEVRFPQKFHFKLIGSITKSSEQTVIQWISYLDFQVLHATFSLAHNFDYHFIWKGKYMYPMQRVSNSHTPLGASKWYNKIARTLFNRYFKSIWITDCLYWKKSCTHTIRKKNLVWLIRCFKCEIPVRITGAQCLRSLMGSFPV